MTDEGFETITYSAADGLATITLNRPEKRNAMNLAMFHELGEATERAAGDDAVHAVLVRGAGPGFCAGIDLGLMGELAGMAATGGEEGFGLFVSMAQRPYRTLATMPKPTVAAVQGHAIGAGFQLALACDLRVLADDASFAMLEARYGLIPDLGGMHHLARLVGPARAKELVWTTREVPAEEAERIGLANRVAPAVRMEDAARELVHAILATSPHAAALTKQLIGSATEAALADELEREGAAQGEALRGADHRESVAAFLERRAPNFNR